MQPILEVSDLGKQYRLGEVGTGTLSHDLNRWWARIRGKEDPFLKIGESNDRSKKGSSDYVWALREVSFEVAEGEILGIIGKNGAGKSTLLKILSKVTGPTTGRICSRGRIAALLEVGTGFHPELTGRENVFLNGAILGMTKKEVKSKFDEIVDFAGVSRYIDTPVKRYSSGMMVRLGFAVAAHLEPEILIVDEVLAVGDFEFQSKCLGKMSDVSKSGRTVLFVSHNMVAINQLCSRTILMDKGSLFDVGETEKIVGTYLRLNQYTEQGSEKLGAYNHKSRISNLKINTLPIGEAVVELGAPLEIGFQINLLDNHRGGGLNIAFRIISSDGITLVNQELIDNGSVDSVMTDKYEVFVKIPALDLYPDHYFISLFVGNIDWTEHYYKMEQISAFTLVDNAKKQRRPLNKKDARVYITPTWKVQ
jgi:lipopolysaccharide transport system ATP-binding protein